MVEVRSATAAERLSAVLERLLGRSPGLRVRAWDGSETGPSGAPVLIVRSRRALRRLLWRPDELGLARAYISGEIEVAGPLLGVLERLQTYARRDGERIDVEVRRELLRMAVLLGAVGPQPKAPPEENRGPLPTVDLRIAGTVLGATLSQTAATFPAEPTPADLDAAQEAALDDALDRLGVASDTRLLQIGCGWGGLLRRAATRGARGVGFAATDEQADYARARLVEAGHGDRFAIHTGNWRAEIGADPQEVTAPPSQRTPPEQPEPPRPQSTHSPQEPEPFDAIAVFGDGPDLLSGLVCWADGADARRLHGLLRPGGRLLAHVVGRRRAASDRGFRAAYIGPSSLVPRIGEVVGAVEEAELEVLELASIRDALVATARVWTANLEAGWEECVREAGSPARLRLWRLAIAGFALALEEGRIGAHRLLAVRRDVAERPWDRLLPDLAPADLELADPEERAAS